MKLSSLPFSLSFNKTKATSVVVVMTAERVVLVYQQAERWVQAETRFSDHYNAGALKTLLQQQGLQQCAVTLVLGRSLYQGLDIDVPSLPESEWEQALPFLIQEWVPWSVSDTFAGVLSPLPQERLHIVATEKSRLFGWVTELQDAKCRVEMITVEEAVWGLSTDDSGRCLVLEQSPHQGWLLSAYRHQHWCFQRQLRGISAFSSLSQSNLLTALDNLALEIQRSLDFLTTQFRDTPIRRVFVLCETETTELVVSTLVASLNVSIEVYSVPDGITDDHDTRLAMLLLQSPFSPHFQFPFHALFPKRALLSLPVVMSVFLGSLAMMTAIWGMGQWLMMEQNKEFAHWQHQVGTVQEALRMEIKRSALSSEEQEKNYQLAKLAASIVEKQQKLSVLQAHTDDFQEGYATVFQQLASTDMRDVSIQNLVFSGHNMTVTGIARHADSVPQWVATFSQYSTLSARRFDQLTLGRNEHNALTFQLQANAS